MRKIEYNIAAEILKSAAARKHLEPTSTGGGFDFITRELGAPGFGPVMVMGIPDDAGSPEKLDEPATVTLIFGPCSASLFKKGSLQFALENRLRAKKDVNGSPEYSLTWNRWTIDGQEPICALRASRRRIADSDFTGWPTPQTLDHIDRKEIRPSRTATGRTGGYITEVLPLTPWATPTVQVVMPEGWATPRAEDAESSGMRHSRGVADTLSAQTGQDLTSSGAGTEKRGVLRPGHSPLDHGIPGRVGLLRGYGNAIVPEAAAEFIEACEGALFDCSC